ncbi:MAG TPA: hypothetical protein VJP85_11015 [Candidatus Baltobacteraceae bacterium]|nr:hypothetical protein [Candidatus Baltobacteraceae bacterium]
MDGYGVGHTIGRNLGTYLTPVRVIVGLAILYSVYFVAVVYPQTATVQLVNESDGTATFYVDGKTACIAYSDQSCTVALRVYRSHTLSADTFYNDAESFVTPLITLRAKKDEVYKYMACGQTGTPGENCGLFAVSTIPATY